jgi:hypothetical protein
MYTVENRRWIMWVVVAKNRETGEIQEVMVNKEFASTEAQAISEALFSLTSFFYEIEDFVILEVIDNP